MKPSRKVSVRIPGSTSNCGAGFDSLGMAVDINNVITVTSVDGSYLVQAERESDGKAQAMVVEAAALFFKQTKREPFGFQFRIEGNVPSARGLGSSVTVRAGIIAALDVLSDTRITRQQIVSMVTELEGHPDNAAASILGGFCVARADPSTGVYIDSIRVDVPHDLVFVTASSLLEVSTNVSRGTLPSKLPYFDAVRSINSAVYLVAAMTTGNYDRLSHAVSDFMHEPYRLPGIPGAAEAIAAGVKAGAYTGWLSGSGSSVMCVCRSELGDIVLAAMRKVYVDNDQLCEAAVLRADNSGLHLA